MFIPGYLVGDGFWKRWDEGITSQHSFAAERQRRPGAPSARRCDEARLTPHHVEARRERLACKRRRGGAVLSIRLTANGSDEMRRRDRTCPRRRATEKELEHRRSGSSQGEPVVR
jgi:hypothetical protein